MATLGSSALTLSDWAKRLDPDGKVPAIVELLSQTNEVLEDMLYIEGNLPTGHRLTMRQGLPEVYFRLLNSGVLPSKSKTAQVDEAVGIMEAWSEVDKDLADLNGNTASFRLSEAMSFLEAMNQKMATTLFYGNSGIAPEEFTGLSVRYSDKAALNAQNILDAGGSGSDNSSIWLVVWGEQSCCGIFPKGSQAGLVHNDLGLQTVQDHSLGGQTIGSARLRAYQDQFQWKSGLALKDWRFACRIANIDISDLTSQVNAANLPELMIKALHRIPSLMQGRAAFYMNRTCYQMLDIQKRADVRTGGQLSYDVVDGKPVLSFRGIPVRRCDVLTTSEARVV